MKVITICGTIAALCALTSWAQAQGAFCAEDGHGYRNCGFQTLAQCRQSLAGMGGMCSPNPGARAAEPPPTPGRKQSRPDR
jgi:hypothetical protein